MSVDLFSDEALAAERARQATMGDDLQTLRAEAWKEISSYHPDLAVALTALKAEFSTSTLPSDEIRKFAAAWRARPENQRASA